MFERIIHHSEEYACQSEGLRFNSILSPPQYGSRKRLSIKVSNSIFAGTGMAIDWLWKRVKQANTKYNIALCR